MKLTSLEKTYFDEFSKSFAKYGNEIPLKEWDHLSKVRKSLDISLKRSKEIIDAVQNHTVIGEEVSNEVSKKGENITVIFRKGVMPLLRHSNNNDCLILSISESDKGSVRNNFGLGLDEQILWVRDTSFWSNKNQGLVITDKQIVYIPDNDKPDDRLNIEFNDIQHVEYREMSLFVWNYQNEYYQLGLGLFFKDTTESNELIADAKTLANVLTNMAKSVGHVETETVFDHMNNLMSEENYDEVIDCAKEVVSDVDNDNDTKCIAYMYLSDALSKKGEKDSHKGMNSYMRDAIEACDQAMELCEDEDPFRYTIFKRKGEIEQMADDVRSARNCFIAAMDSDDFDLKKDAKNSYELLTREISRDKNSFLNDDYNKRKFLFTVNNDKQISGCYDKEDNVQWIFALGQIPDYINFPIGHPQPNTLYIGHPLKPGVYIPFENATEQLFMERVHELCYLGQCLGANEIRIKRLRGLDTASSEAKQLDVSGELDVKAVNVGGSFGRNTAAQNSYSSKDGMEMVQTYLPTKQPYCPDDLVWLDSETSWQALVKQRLNGNILSYSLHLSSSESVSMTSSKVLSVKASFEYLVTKASGSYDAKTDKTFSKTEEIEWEIDMQFKPLQDFEDDNVDASNGQAVAQIAQTQNSELSEDELAYKEEVEFCLEDAPEIDAHSRKFLERKRQKLGLSETRAQEIEDMVKASLVSFTDEEKEYMEVLDDVIEDGAIPNNVRRLLERERKSLGISEERAKELEEIKCKV